jgi:hypothetical protein
MVMRFIPTRVHGVLDYAVGGLLAVSPWLLDYAEGEAETWLPVALGAGALGYSLLTDYELGASKRIPMKTHLKLDAASGALLAASPWLLGFSRRVWVPHVLFGLFEVAAALTTRPQPTRRGAR